MNNKSFTESFANTIKDPSLNSYMSEIFSRKINFC